MATLLASSLSVSSPVAFAPRNKIFHLNLVRLRTSVPIASVSALVFSNGSISDSPYLVASPSVRRRCSCATNPQREEAPLSFEPRKYEFLEPVLPQSVPPFDLVSSNETEATLTFINSDEKIEKPISLHQPKTKTQTQTQKRNPRNPKHHNLGSPPRNVLDCYQIIKYPLATECAIKNIVDNNTLVFVVDRRADKKNIKDAVKNLFDIRIKKVNTLMQPDRNKKAYVMLTSDYVAADVAKKFKII